MRVFRFLYARAPRPAVKAALIPRALYRKIHENVPIVCADLVVRHRGNFLLVKRGNAPERGKWFIPGGRVLKNEALAEAARRKLFEETGQRGGTPKFLAVTEHFNERGYFPGSVSHMITFVFLVDLPRKRPLQTDSQSTDIRWFSAPPRGLHPYPRAMLRLARGARS